MDKLVVAQINADMRIGKTSRVEKDQISRLQLFLPNRSCTLGDFRRTVRQAHAKRLLVNKPYHATAIKSGLGIRAAELVTNIKQTERDHDHFARRAVSLQTG